MFQALLNVYILETIGSGLLIIRFQDRSVVSITYISCLTVIEIEGEQELVVGMGSSCCWSYVSSLSCACLLHPKSRNQGKGMLEVPWLAVEPREWFASTRSTFQCRESWFNLRNFQSLPVVLLAATNHFFFHAAKGNTGKEKKLVTGVRTNLWFPFPAAH